MKDTLTFLSISMSIGKSAELTARGDGGRKRDEFARLDDRGRGRGGIHASERVSASSEKSPQTSDSPKKASLSCVREL